ncbi:MAG: hypothetical protein GWN84_24445 [Gammaproteobacteria bacterium]|nr:hypothetical protein [Gammaproteobacteria bacterium]NIR85735.1 hypothetical protein [Gammaproteobacteria bacterium]NIR90268.1 hypothetical protein [Gammaproteobacteria bacterium]NIU06869.1 hypothetical protein [Gammaproteobacteria bacterium]NIV53802.1 hypothetical protein [Gammaproteobacteria bacterium]
MKLAPLLVALALAAAAPTTLAQGLHFLKNSPVSYFDDEDWRLMQEAIREALDNNPDGEKVSWENPKTGHNGSVTPLNTYQDFGTTCRRARLFNEAESASGASTFNFCKDTEEDRWKVAS